MDIWFRRIESDNPEKTAHRNPGIPFFLCLDFVRSRIRTGVQVLFQQRYKSFSTFDDDIVDPSLRPLEGSQEKQFVSKSLFSVNQQCVYRRTVPCSAD